MSSPQEIFRSGFVALSGLANAGKSTLLNAILGQTISIVSPKPQTTRNRILGIHNLPGVQIILVDTPGLTAERDELGRRMVKGALAAIGDADVVVRVVDATKYRVDEPSLRGDSGRSARPKFPTPTGAPVIVALNKVDVVRPKGKLLPMIAALSQEEGVEVVIPISALRKDGIDELLSEVQSRLPEGPLLYPEEMITDRPERFLAAEFVRAAVLRHTRNEVPHATAVSVTEWRESKTGCHIEAVIFVERESQKAILIGKGGAMIKTIGEAAREEIGHALECEAHLSLRVDVASRWRGDPKTLRQLGYDE